MACKSGCLARILNQLYRVNDSIVYVPLRGKGNDMTLMA